MSCGDVGETAFGSDRRGSRITVPPDMNSRRLLLIPLMSKPIWLIITMLEQRVLKFATISRFVGMLRVDSLKALD